VIAPRVSFIAASTWIRLRFGPHFEYADYDYDFRQMVSGGGPFFSHRLEYEFDVARYGAMFGVGIEQRLGDGFGWRAEGYVLPSWRDLELRGRQSGSALGSARAKDSDNGLGFLGGWAPLVFLVGFTGLEIVVAFLQALIFTVLTCIYLNAAIHPGH